MFMSRCCPLMAIVPISLFLTISFFVLYVLRKVTEKRLKVFGYLTMCSLLLAVLVIFSSAISNLAQGLGGLTCTMPQKMKMCDMARMMQQKGAPEMGMPEKKAPPRE